MPCQSAAADANPIATDEAALKAAGVGIDGPGLLRYFREHTLTKASRAHVIALIRDLGQPSFRTRERASEELVRLGTLAVPLLREAVKDPDLEVSRRAERCLQHIDSGPSTELAAAAARLVAVRKPEGAAGVLLAYLPDAPDEGVADKVRTALLAVAIRDGRPELAVLQALTDRVAERRAAAGEALCLAGVKAERPAARKLLADRDALVRLRIALALARTGEREAVPVLITLLGELPPEHVWRAEDILLQLAGDRAPTDSIGPDGADRLKVRDAWRSWWEKHQTQADLARLGDVPTLLGFTLVAYWDQGQDGHVVELGPDGKLRRETPPIPWPIDFHLLPGNRLLCAEYYIHKVTERDFKGHLLWEKDVPENPLAAQRLPSGNTFIVMRGRLVEVDRNGKDVVALPQAANDVVSAIKTRNGQISLITTGGQFKRLDAAGKELKTFPVGTVHSYAAIDVLPNGNVLVPHYDRNNVTEYDNAGKVVWEGTVSQPTAPVRLPNGHTLVACRDGQTVVELDRAGKTVWSQRGTAFPWRVRRR
jgi:hypothetical protein